MLTSLAHTLMCLGVHNAHAFPSAAGLAGDDSSRNSVEGWRGFHAAFLMLNDSNLSLTFKEGMEGAAWSN